jgi:hypothetical protein
MPPEGDCGCRTREKKIPGPANGRAGIKTMRGSEKPARPQAEATLAGLGFTWAGRLF